MSDYEYDELFDELKKLESETNFKLANSPTMTVGFDVVDKLNKVKHNHPMLSLDKTKSVDEVQKFIDLGWAYRGVKNKPTYNELLKLREQGLSYQRIGEMYGVTESCVRRWKKKYESR